MPGNETRQGTGVIATQFVTSKDGTRIAYERTGQGPPVIIVAGAFGNRSFGDPLSPLLAPHFTAFYYDRRGRNESGDTLPYAVEREVEDIEALLNEVGGSAFVHGMSSGAVLALEAATRLSGIQRLTLYEPPLLVDDSRPPVPDDYLNRIKAAVSAGRRGDAVEIFMTAAIQLPPEAIAQMRNEPMWPALEAVAHTLPYDAAFMDGLMSGKPLPAEHVQRWSAIKVPILVLVGTATWPFMHGGAEALAKALPNVQRRTLDGQTHDVSPEALAPELVEFFTA
jgi:pimeloyl-ACP methyl ester carboxylesterase